MTRCPDCDKPIASDEDDNPDDVLRCYRQWHGDVCQWPPVDWRARCPAMTPVIEAAERYYDQHGAIETMRDLAVEVTKYRKRKEGA